MRSTLMHKMRGWLNVAMTIIGIIAVIMVFVTPSQVTKDNIRYQAGTSGFKRWVSGTCDAARGWDIHNYGVVRVARRGNRLLVGYNKKWTITDARKRGTVAYPLCWTIDKVLFRDSPWNIPRNKDA